MPVAPAAVALAVLLASAPFASAQAWVAPAGVGSVSVGFQWIDNTGHRLTDGSRIENGESVNAAVYLEADYAVTDRFSLTAGLPYVFAKWTSTDPPPPFLPFLPRDQCHCWHSGWQDFGLTARYNVIGSIGGGFALTPSVSIGLPTHDYEYRGEAVLGRNLREVRVALDAGRRLDPISPKLSLQGRYSYAFVERVLDIRNDRSNYGIELGYQLSRKLYSRAFTSWQRTHGGLRLGAPPPSDLLPPGEVNTPERLEQHDRLLRDNFFHAGAGLAYQLPHVDLFASYVEYVSGTDTHSGRAFTVGVSWPFEVRRAH